MCCVCGVSEDCACDCEKENRELDKDNKRGFLAGEFETVDEKQEDNEDVALGQ